MYSIHLSTIKKKEKNFLKMFLREREREGGGREREGEMGGEFIVT